MYFSNEEVFDVIRMMSAAEYLLDMANPQSDEGKESEKRMIEAYNNLAFRLNLDPYLKKG